MSLKILEFPESAYLVTVANSKLYDAVPSSSPITVTGTAPSTSFRCKAKVIAVANHTDCSGSLIIGTETLTFTTSGQTKLTSVLLSSNPTVSYVGLDCHILIEYIDASGAPIVTETSTATKIQFENTASGFFNSSGQWTVYSGSYALCKDSANINDILRYNSTDMPIKKVDTEKWFSKILYYIFYL